MNQKKEEESSLKSKYVASVVSVVDTNTTLSTKTVSTTTPSSNTVIGRPKGLTNLKKQHEREIVLQGGGSKTLMAAVEPYLAELICAMVSI